MFLKSLTAKPLLPEDFALLVAQTMVVPPKVRLHMLGRPALYEEALKQIKVPVLVTHGMEDRVGLLSMARYTVSIVPHARSSFYEGVGHMPFWEDAARFNRELAAFVIESGRH